MNKIIEWSLKVGAGALAIILLAVVLRVAWNFVWYGQATVPGVNDASNTSQQYSQPRDNARQGEINALMRQRQAQEAARKKQFDQNCDRNDASPRDWGQGYYSCHRQGGVQTYIGGVLVDRY